MLQIPHGNFAHLLGLTILVSIIPMIRSMGKDIFMFSGGSGYWNELGENM